MTHAVLAHGGGPGLMKWRWVCCGRILQLQACPHISYCLTSMTLPVLCMDINCVRCTDSVLCLGSSFPDSFVLCGARMSVWTSAVPEEHYSQSDLAQSLHFAVATVWLFAAVAAGPERCTVLFQSTVQALRSFSNRLTWPDLVVLQYCTGSHAQCCCCCRVTSALLRSLRCRVIWHTAAAAWMCCWCAL